MRDHRVTSKPWQKRPNQYSRIPLQVTHTVIRGSLNDITGVHGLLRRYAANWSLSCCESGQDSPAV